MDVVTPPLARDAVASPRRTLGHIWRRFQRNRDRATSLYDERFCRMWEFYLVAVEMLFRHGSGMVFQMQLARERDAAEHRPPARQRRAQPHEVDAVARGAPARPPVPRRARHTTATGSRFAGLRPRAQGQHGPVPEGRHAAGRDAGRHGGRARAIGSGGAAGRPRGRCRRTRARRC